LLGKIEFKSVKFVYGERKNEVLSNFSVTIPAGQRAAIVG
jgi:ABC-type bacteriocin/lantibiotic exporter with double-glycine peptidase domain